MAYPILPPELIILIINNIDSSSIEGRDTLSAFGQTGHAFRVVCQEILFQDLKIVDRYPPYSRIEPRENMIRLEHPRSQRFNDILREAPHLGGYIQSLRLSLLPSRGDPFNADLVVKGAYVLKALPYQISNHSPFLQKTLLIVYQWSILVAFSAYDVCPFFRCSVLRS